MIAFKERARSVVVLGRDRPVLQLLVILILIVLGVSTIPGIAARLSIYSILTLAALLGIAAAGQTVVILLGGIDVSVPSIITGANLLTALWSGERWPFILIIVVLCLGAAVVGVINGLLVRTWDIPPLIATFGTGSVAIGVALVASRSGVATGTVPVWLTHFSSPIGMTGPLALPPVIVAWIVLAIAVAIALGFTLAGRRVYAIGSNSRAASLARVPVTRVFVGAMVFSAVMSAIVGLLSTGFSGAGDINAGSPYFFTSIAAVLVGGNALLGGRGDYWRTIMGALIITFAGVIMVGYGWTSQAQEIFTGILILLAVGLYGRDKAIKDRL